MKFPLFLVPPLSLWLTQTKPHCRQLVFNHRHSLGEQLKTERDPAMTLHLAVVLLFQTLTQCMLHCPGRLVPAVLAHLATLMEADALVDLTAMQSELDLSLCKSQGFNALNICLKFMGTEFLLAEFCTQITDLPVIMILSIYTDFSPLEFSELLIFFLKIWQNTDFFRNGKRFSVYFL